VPCGGSSPKCALGEVKMRVNKPCWADRCGRATPIKSCASLARATSKKRALHRVSRRHQVCPRKGAHWFNLDFIDSLYSMHSSYSRCQLFSSVRLFWVLWGKKPICSRGIELFTNHFHILFALLSFLNWYGISAGWIYCASTRASIYSK